MNQIGSYVGVICKARLKSAIVNRHCISGCYLVCTSTGFNPLDQASGDLVCIRRWPPHSPESRSKSRCHVLLRLDQPEVLQSVLQYVPSSGVYHEKVLKYPRDEHELAYFQAYHSSYVPTQRGALALLVVPTLKVLIVHLL